jgi:hypothetical protein
VSTTLDNITAEDRAFLDDVQRVLDAGLPKEDLLSILEAIGSKDKIAALNQLAADRWHPLTKRAIAQALDVIAETAGGAQ